MFAKASILSQLDRKFQDLDIRRAFTVFQLMTILEESLHSLIVIKHDPLLYENAQGMVEYVSQGLHYAAKEAAVLLYSPATDTFQEDPDQKCRSSIPLRRRAES